MSSIAHKSPPIKPRSREWGLVLGYAVSIITVFLLAISDGWLQSGRPSPSPRVMEPAIFPILYFYTPPLLALYNELRGGSIGGSMLLGATPGLTFPILAGFAAIIRTGNGDAPAWALTLTFLGIGIAGAVVVIVLIRSLRLAFEHVQ